MLVFLMLGAVIAGFFWLVTLPIRLAFRLVFGLVFGLIFGVGGFLLRMLFTPVIFILAAIALLVGIVAGLVALITHLLPLAFLGLVAWGIYRFTTNSPTAMQRY
jgi:hypothetical protein